MQSKSSLSDYRIISLSPLFRDDFEIELKMAGYREEEVVVNRSTDSLNISAYSEFLDEHFDVNYYVPHDYYQDAIEVEWKLNCILIKVKKLCYQKH